MNITSLVIPIYNWKLIVFTSVKADDVPSVISECNKYGVPETQVKETLTQIINRPNNGVHLGSSTGKVSILFYAPITNKLNFWGMVPHEIDHLISCIVETLGLESEARAYLTGFIYSTLYQLNVFEFIEKDYIEVVNEAITTRELMKQFLINLGEIKPEKLEEVPKEIADKWARVNSDLDELINVKFEKFDEVIIPRQFIRPKA